MVESLMFAHPLEMLLYADTWEKKRQVFEAHQEVLLTKEAIDLLEALDHKFRFPSGVDDENSQLQSVAISMYRGLLIQARTLGPRPAWAIFRMYMTLLRL